MIANILIAAIAALHFYILVIEMFLWSTPRARRAFNLTEDLAAKTKVMAANQGLYNGFLAAGLVTGLVMGPSGLAFKLFFLICVALAGAFGAATVKGKILFIQTLPALLALGALLAGV